MDVVVHNKHSPLHSAAVSSPELTWTNAPEPTTAPPLRPLPLLHGRRDVTAAASSWSAIKTHRVRLNKHVSREFWINTEQTNCTNVRRREHSFTASSRSVGFSVWSWMTSRNDQCSDATLHSNNSRSETWISLDPDEKLSESVPSTATTRRQPASGN